jgi:hypothetical protein
MTTLAADLIEGYEAECDENYLEVRDAETLESSF